MEKEIDGKKFEIRPLTRGEVKSLRKKGYNIGNLSLENADDAADEILEMVCGPEQIREVYALPNDKALELFKAIIDLSYGQGEDEKNLKPSGSGTKAADRPDAADA
jgi:hypothetical protein